MGSNQLRKWDFVVPRLQTIQLWEKGKERTYCRQTFVHVVAMLSLASLSPWAKACQRIARAQCLSCNAYCSFVCIYVCGPVCGLRHRARDLMCLIGSMQHFKSWNQKGEDHSILSLNFRSYKYISPKKSECRSDLHSEVEPQWCTAMCIDAVEHILHTWSDCAMKECVSLAEKWGSWINYVIPVKWQSVVANGSRFVAK